MLIQNQMRLSMVHFRTNENDKCVVFVYWMWQTIIDDYFAIVCGNTLSENKIGFLYMHNRGYLIEDNN